MSKEDVCVKCGANLLYYGTECTPIACSEDLHAQLSQCRCDICECSLRTINKICAKCIKGYHRAELRV